MVVVEVRVRHPQRVEELGLGELPQALSRNPGHDLAEQDVAGVAVQVLVARRKVEFALPGDRVEDVLVGDEVLAPVPRQGEEHDVVAHAGGVVDQVSDGGRVGVVGKFGDVALHGSVRFHLSPEGEQGDRSGRELLGDRRDAVDGRGPVRDAVFEVGGSVAGGVHQAAVADHAHGAAGPVVASVVGEDGVDPGSHPGVALGGAPSERTAQDCGDQDRGDRGRADEMKVDAPPVRGQDRPRGARLKGSRANTRRTMGSKNSSGSES